MIFLNSSIKKLLQGNKGSATIEATFVLPTIFIILFSLVFLCLFMYQKFNLLEAAAYTAKQRAETWDNTGRDMESGIAVSRDGDGLYWRIFQDYAGSGLVGRKIEAARSIAAGLLDGGVIKSTGAQVWVRFKNLIAGRTVSVDIEQIFFLPFRWLTDAVGSRLSVGADADVAEPVEFIRNVDLAETYSAEILAKLQDYAGKFNSGNSLPGTRLVASTSVQYGKRVRVYHYPDCRYALRITPGNRVEFNDPAEANAHGYYLCTVCAKRAAGYSQ